jgi:predicted DNA-binding transcriptional regulator AlpA
MAPTQHSLAPPELLSAQAVSRMLGIGTRSLWRYIAAGKVPRPVRIGRAVRWRRLELDDWIKAGCPQSKQGGQTLI